jgi:nucleoside-diphosphate-sugar epimerase
MKVLVCGAAGFLGLAVVRSLAREGHDVRGLVRAPGQRELVAGAGGRPVVGSVLDAASLRAAADGCDAAIHLAQAPGDGGERAAAVRIEGASNLRAVAHAGRLSRLVIGSGYWVYRSHPGVISEDSPVEPLGLSRWNYEAERRAQGPAPPEVVVVRPGMVYGNGSWFREMVEELAAGRYRYVADGRNRLSPVALEDAAEAFSRVLTDAPAGSTYLVVDDAPVRTTDFAAHVADRLGSPPPQSLAFDAAVAAWGEELARLNAADRAASNARLRGLGWRPRFPTFRDGLPAYVDAIGQELRRRPSAP